MLILILITIVVAALCLLLIPLASHLHLVANPGEHRMHQKPTPMVGGLAIFCGVVAGIYFVAGEDRALLPVLLIICVTGALDDRFHLPSILRIVIQAAAAVLMIKLTGVELHSLGEVFSDTSYKLATWSMPLTVFAVIGVINAFNMSDGMDGLAGSLALLVSAALVLLSPNSGLQTIQAIIAAAVLGFLLWNLRIGRTQAKIFMGDAGSTLLGVVLAYVLIKSSQEPAATITPIMALWIMTLPLFDAVGVLLTRALDRKSPFSADRSHYHHILQEYGLGVNASLGVILFVQACFIYLGYSFANSQVPQQAQMQLFLFLFLAYTFFLYVWRKRHFPKT